MLGIAIGITSFETGLKLFAITRYKSIIKKKKKRHDLAVLLPKCKLNSIEVVISKSLIDSLTSHDEFVLIINVRKEYDEMKEEIKNLKTYIVHLRLRSIFKTNLSYCLKCRKNNGSKTPNVARTKNGRIML